MNRQEKEPSLLREWAFTALMTAPIVVMLFWGVQAVSGLIDSPVLILAFIVASALLGALIERATRFTRIKRPEQLLDRSNVAEPPMEHRRDFTDTIDLFLKANLGSSGVAAFVIFQFSDPARQYVTLGEHERNRLSRKIMAIIRGRIRGNDLICQTGQGEYAVFLPVAPETRIHQLVMTICAQAMAATAALTGDRMGARLVSGWTLADGSDTANNLRQRALANLEAPDTSGIVPASDARFGRR